MRSNTHTMLNVRSWSSEREFELHPFRTWVGTKSDMQHPDEHPWERKRRKKARASIAADDTAASAVFSRCNHLNTVHSYHSLFLICTLGSWLSFTVPGHLSACWFFFQVSGLFSWQFFFSSYFSFFYFNILSLSLSLSIFLLLLGISPREKS